jgi:hypothetical protein
MNLDKNEKTRNLATNEGVTYQFPMVVGNTNYTEIESLDYDSTHVIFRLFSLSLTKSYFNLVN